MLAREGQSEPLYLKLLAARSEPSNQRIHCTPMSPIPTIRTLRLSDNSNAAAHFCVTNIEMRLLLALPSAVELSATG